MFRLGSFREYDHESIHRNPFDSRCTLVSTNHTKMICTNVSKQLLQLSTYIMLQLIPYLKLKSHTPDLCQMVIMCRGLLVAKN